MPSAVASRDEAGHVTIRAVRLTEPLDGRFNERRYDKTDSITNCVQQEPFEGEPATDKTDVWVTYAEDAVYVGARFWDNDSSKRITSDRRRDTHSFYKNDYFTDRGYRPLLTSTAIDKAARRPQTTVATPAGTIVARSSIAGPLLRSERVESL